MIGRRPARQPIVHEASGDGPPLVLVHGLSGSRNWWQHNVSALSRHFRVYSIDLPGFGDSRSLGRPRLDQAVLELIYWMDCHELHRVSIAGHSLGGMIAARLAAESPARIQRLILVSAALLTFDPGLKRRTFGLARESGRMPIRGLAMMGRDAVRAGPLNLIFATQQLLSADWTDQLHAVQAPTLVLWGAEDALVPSVVGVRIAAAIPDSRLVILPSASHVPMWDAPDAFNREVIRFLKDSG